jgi:F0F1-type ATP synthase assembly protein I
VRRPDGDGDQNSYGELMQLAIQASSIVGGMVIPALIGGYLDYRWGTQFCVLIGIGLGVVAGTVQLLALARRGVRKVKTDRKLPADEQDKNEDPDRDSGT